MGKYGQWGSPNALLEAWWEQAVLVEAARASGLTESERIVEAESKTDFVDWLFGYSAASFYKAYEQAEVEWRRYVKVTKLRDFNEHKTKGRNRLKGFGYVGEHGHYPGSRRSFRPEASLYLDTYGQLQEITRQAIINQEDETILRDDPADMGHAAAMFLARAIVSLIASNALAPDGDPMYSAAGGGGRGNQLSAELDETSFVQMWTLMDSLVDDDGDPITVTPRHCLVQNMTWLMVGNRIVKSQRTGATQTDPDTDDFARGDANPIATHGVPDDFFIKERLLPDANDWYFLGDKDTSPAYQVGLLRGQEDPVILRENPQARAVTGGASDPYPVDLDVARFKSRWDLGVGTLDPRNTARSTPA